MAECPRRSDRARSASDDRGSATPLVVGGLAVIALATALAVVIAGYLLAARRASSAADLAALSGATAYAASGSPEAACGSARRTAALNGAALSVCRVHGGEDSFVVEVALGVAVQPAPRGLPSTLGGRAWAGPAGLG